jgi:hypothetical protein
MTCRKKAQQRQGLSREIFHSWFFVKKPTMPQVCSLISFEYDFEFAGGGGVGNPNVLHSPSSPSPRQICTRGLPRDDAHQQVSSLACTETGMDVFMFYRRRHASHPSNFFLLLSLKWYYSISKKCLCGITTRQAYTIHALNLIWIEEWGTEQGQLRLQQTYSKRFV